MSRRSSITGGFGSGVFEKINANIGSVVTVADNIDSIKQLMDMPGFEDLLIDVRETLDFTNITVVSGEEASWDSDTKVLTVPTVKGDKGDNLTMSSVVDNGDNTFTWGFSDGTVFTTPDLRGAKGDTGVQGPKGEKGERGDDGVPVILTSITDNGDYTFDWEFSDGYIYTTPTLRGHRGLQGEKGDSVSLDEVEHIGDGVFTWTFSDGTVFTTPRLKGDQGPQGATGLRGPQGVRGIGVHHMKGTSTTEPHGDFGTFGEKDTYTFYGDADETMVLGWFTVMNGISSAEELEPLGMMLRRTYDEDEDGIVDNSNRLGGKKLEELGLFYSVGSFAEITDIDSDVHEGDIVLVRDNGAGEWVLVSIDQKDPALVTSTVMSQKLEEFVGDESELTTTAKRLPTAINELDEEIGDVTTLTTASKVVVEAINELDEEIDELLDLKLDKAGGTIENDLTIQGNLYVNGTETVVNTETLEAVDNEITINAGEPGNGVTKGSAGIRVDRGSESDYLFQFDETSDSFKIGEEGNLQQIATREDTPLDAGVAVWDDSNSRFNTTKDLDIDSLNTTGLVNGRDIPADGTKLDDIEEKATADQTAEEIEALYESNPDTNKYTDQEKQFVDADTALDTVATTLPSAVNEVHSEVDSIVDGTTDIVFDNAGTFITASTLEDAIKEIGSEVGDVGILDTDATTTVGAINELHTTIGTLTEAVEKNTAVTGTSTLVRYDKLLGNLDVVQMGYTGGDLTTVRYAGDNNTDSFYRDVLVYSSGNLTSIKHYYDKPDLVTESAETVLVYDVDSNLISTQYTEL